MKNPKSKISPGARPRDASIVKKPRPRRPRPLYTEAEVREIFRRFAVQRPEPRGELEHVNAF